MAKRMRGLYKRGNVWWCCYKTLSGKVVRETTGQTGYDNAVEFLMKRKTEVDAGKLPEARKITNHTFRELAVEYLKWCERQRSYRSKLGFVRQLDNVFGDMPLRHFGTKMVEQFQTDRIAKGNKPATINRLVATLKHMFNKAVQWEMVEESALKRVRQAKLLEENNRRLKYLSQEECQRLVDACEPQHLRPIVVMALNTGMRKGEILTLKWENVDLKHSLILLEMTKNGERKELPINNTLGATLQGIPRGLNVPHVFFDPLTGKPFRDVRRSFKTACRRAGIKDFHFHDLRHTFASHLVMAGVDLTTVKELLGHKTLTMTLRYAHLAPAHKAKAVDILDRVVNRNSTSQLLHSKAL